MVGRRSTDLVGGRSAPEAAHSATRREPVAVIGNTGIRSAFRDGAHRLGDIELLVSSHDEHPGTRVEWTLRNPGRRPVSVDRVGIEVSTPPGLVLEHGWQSWSVVRRCDRSDVRSQRRRAPRYRNAMLLADPESAGEYVSGDQFLLDESGMSGFLSAESHFGTITAVSDHRVVAWALLDGVTLPGGHERRLDPLWIASGAPGEIYSRFASLWGDRSAARATTEAKAGWCSWYRHQSAVTPDDVRRAARECARHGLSVVQVDDGHQAAIGDWTDPSPSWGEGTRAVASELAGAGLTPGLWTAPFLVGPGSRVLEKHPEWLLCDRRGRRIGAMNHPSLWGGWTFALDTTRPEVLDHVRGVFSALAGDGFTYHKLDFLYAAALPGLRHDTGATRAESLRRGLDAIREAVGDDAFLLACGCPFGPAVGVVDGMRVSTDIWRHWSMPGELPGYPESRSGLRNSLRASMLRAPLHRRLWINDADCLLLEGGSDGLSEHHRDLMVDAVAGTGGYTVLSDELSSYTDDDWETVSRLLRAPDGPLDLVDPFARPVVVRSPGSELTVDWRGDGHARLEEVTR